MKKNLVSLVCFFSFAFSASVSQAIYIEPYVGMLASSTLKFEIPSAPTNNSESDLSGTPLGLKLGWSFAGLSVGVDYQTGSIKSKETSGSSVGTETDNKMNNLGVFADYDFPVIPIHVYGAYIFDSKITIEDPSGDTEISGSGMKVGVGFTGLPFVAINVDMTTLKHDEATPAFPLAFTAESTLMMVSVSLPLNF